MKKYFKPRSVAWWASATPLILGIVAAVAPVVPNGETIAVVIDNMTGGVEPYILINAGLAGIGLRAAL